MNLFATNECPIKAAQDHNSVHLRKMVVEVLQMLSTAHIVLDGKQVAYKKTHEFHPCSVWIRECSGNYQWAFEHYKALCEEYTFRTGKIHKSQEHLEAVKNCPVNITQGERTPFALAMPDEFKILGVFDQTVAYQKYLAAKFAEWACREKPIKVEWHNRNKPEWMEI